MLSPSLSFFFFFSVSHSCLTEVHVHPACTEWHLSQSVCSMLHFSSLFPVFVWLTCHPQKMFASPRRSRLDTLARSHSEPCLKKDSQLASALFIDTKTCSHSGGPLFILYYNRTRLPHHQCGLFWCQIWTFCGGSASAFHMLEWNSNRCISDELDLKIFN